MCEGLQIISRFGSFENHECSEFLQHLSNEAKIVISRNWYSGSSSISIRKKFKPSDPTKFAKAAFDADMYIWSKAGVRLR